MKGSETFSSSSSSSTSINSKGSNFDSYLVGGLFLPDIADVMVGEGISKVTMVDVDGTHRRY